MHTNWIAPSIEFRQALESGPQEVFELFFAHLPAGHNELRVFVLAKPRDVTSDRHVERRINEDQVGFPATQQR
jgi:hypothetical protein